MWITTKWILESSTIDYVRSKIAGHQLALENYTQELSMLAFGFGEKVGFFSSYMIEKKVRLASEYPIGAIGLLSGGAGKKRDTIVATYLLVKLGTGMILEGIRTVERPNVFTFYKNGVACGELVETTEMEIEKPRSWWQRLFCGKRKWKLFVAGDLYGALLMQYPLDSKKQLCFHLKKEMDLPISVSRRANFHHGGGTRTTPVVGLIKAIAKGQPITVSHGDMIIPMNTLIDRDNGYDTNIELLHFLLNILFRIHFFTLDFSSD